MLTMTLSGRTAFSGFSTDDVATVKPFYADVLGLDATEDNGMLNLTFPNGHVVLVYPKGENHEPASFTVLNFEVDDIDAVVDELAAKGIVFEQYPDFPGQDRRGVMRGQGPAIAWFKDPAGNILSVIETA